MASDLHPDQALPLLLNDIRYRITIIEHWLSTLEHSPTPQWQDIDSLMPLLQQLDHILTQLPITLCPESDQQH